MSNPLGTNETPRECGVIVILAVAIAGSLIVWAWIISKCWGGG